MQPRDLVQQFEMDHPEDFHHSQERNRDEVAQNFDKATHVACNLHGQAATKMFGESPGFLLNHQPSRFPDGQHYHAPSPILEADDNTRGISSMVWNEWPAPEQLSAGRGLRSENPEALDIDIDYAGMHRPTWSDEQHGVYRIDWNMLHIYQSSPISFNAAWPCEHSVPRAANYGPWNALHMDPSMDICNQTHQRTSVSSVEHYADFHSQGDISSGSNAEASQTPGTSEDVRQARDGDGPLTAQQQQPFSPQISGQYLMPPRYPTHGWRHEYGISMSPGNGSHTGLSSDSRSPSRHALSFEGADVVMIPLSPPIMDQHGSPSTSSVQCRHPGCGRVFQGSHALGSMHRHMRLKHSKEEERAFPCPAAGCDRAFKRQDARLKHMRRKHPELGTAEAQPRGKFGDRLRRADAAQPSSSVASYPPYMAGKYNT